MLLTFILIIISIPPPSHSFRLKTSLFCKLTVAFPFFFRTDSMDYPDPGLFTDTSEHTRFFTF